MALAWGSNRLVDPAPKFVVRIQTDERDDFPDLDALLNPPDMAWRKDAACRETPHINFFPAKGQSTEPALAVCARCLVRDECLEWAMTQDYTLSGVWGGMTHRQRRKERTRRYHERKAAA